jgi:hypothetical protein
VLALQEHKRSECVISNPSPELSGRLDYDVDQGTEKKRREAGNIKPTRELEAAFLIPVQQIQHSITASNFNLSPASRSIKTSEIRDIPQNVWLPG